MGRLPGGRLHLQDGPIDLVIHAVGSEDAVGRAYRAATRRFAGVLDELCAELLALRSQARPGAAPLRGPVARAMQCAVAPFADENFITPMAAVAGAVADHILAAMVATAGLDRAFVNNGGDIALALAPGERLRAGVIDRPDRPTLFERIELRAEDAARGLATSGWRGRSFSLGIADSVTVLAISAAAADAAATVLANAVDLPGHPAVQRVPASHFQPDSDLGERLVTRDVGALSDREVERALAAGLACARPLIQRGLVFGAAFRLRGETRFAGVLPLVAEEAPPPGRDLATLSRVHPEPAHA